jgi:hypothetical protein
MGQTLTHGVYLPDEGERNCYSGLASNWSILDGAVGTIAEHTTALAGKAPAVHTHTKADITDFPAYGNTAGTICEGNDSRLSDARTPVAHTHTKSDVTNLFNSANTWSANQNLKNTAITDYKANPSADTGIAWNFTSNDNKYWGGFGHSYLTTGVSEVRIFMSNWKTSGLQGFWHLDFGATKDFSNVYFRPSGNNNVNLGSSSYQWNNVYAKGYYYNGTAWGLDKENTWTNSNYFQGNLYQKSGSGLVKGTIPSSVAYYGAFRHYTNSNQEINLFRGYIGTTGDNCYRWTVGPWVSGSTGRFQMRVSSDGTVRAFEVDGTEVSPFTNNTTDLGTSTNKWKTLNGSNPGALSLPNSASSQSLDVSAQGLNWDLTGATDTTYTPTFDGWLQLRCKDIAGDFLFATCGSVRQSVSGSGYISGLNAGLALTIPMENGRLISMRCKASSKFNASIIPCFGNV